MSRLHKTPLPSWAIEPIDMNGAAAVLGVSRRTFIAILARHPHYELRGRKKVFYPEHITLISRPLKIINHMI